MNISNGKRLSTDDINERRKRTRTLSNDLLRGFDANNGIDSDTSSEISDESHFLTTDSETDYEEDKVKQIEKDKCHKCDNTKKLLEMQTEMLNLLKEIKSDNMNMHKRLLLEIQLCRQEIKDEVQKLKRSVIKVINLSKQTVRNADNDIVAIELMDEDSSSDEQDVFHR